MLIQIPTDLTIVTLSSVAHTAQQRFTPQVAQNTVRAASAILEARANIRFTLGETTSVTELLPPGMGVDALDAQGFAFLSSRHSAGRGVRVLCVDRMARTELGGQAREETRLTVIPYNQHVQAAGRILAHEFGHLLGHRGHVNDGVAFQPGREAEWTEMTRNLMYSGSSSETLLTDQQVSAMRSSQLARRFGGGAGH